MITPPQPQGNTANLPRRSRGFFAICAYTLSLTFGAASWSARAQAEVEVRGNTRIIVDGDATPSSTDHTNFGLTCVGSPVNRTFTVKNLGADPLTTADLVVPEGYTVVEELSGEIPAGEQDTFTVRLAGTTTGTYAGDVSFTNNDSDENPFNFRISGLVGAPDVEVLGNAVVIEDGDATPSLADHTDFGVTALGTPVYRVFTVRNLGTCFLMNMFMLVPSGYTVTEGLTGGLPPGGSDTFTVCLTATTPGIHAGEIGFMNNDSDETPFNFQITGQVDGGGDCRDGWVMSLTPGTLRNNAGGYRGLRLKVGSTPIHACSLGRVYVEGNSLPHELVLVEAASGTTVGSVLWTPDGGVHNQIQYADLAVPVTLSADTEYFLGSAEVVGGDTWYSYNTSVTTTGDASVLSAAYKTGASWVSLGGPNTSYVPVSLKCCDGEPPPPPPPPPPACGPLVTEFTPGTLRNNVGGYRGMKFRTGPGTLEVAGLGRVYVDGNSQDHELVLVEAATGVTVASAIWTPEGGVHDAIKYVSLAEPITLPAETEYYLGSAEVSGGDTWYSFNTIVTTTDAATVLSPAYKNGTSWVEVGSANCSYVPVSLAPVCPPNATAGGSRELVDRVLIGAGLADPDA